MFDAYFVSTGPHRGKKQATHTKKAQAHRPDQKLASPQPSALTAVADSWDATERRESLAGWQEVQIFIAREIFPSPTHFTL